MGVLPAGRCSTVVGTINGGGGSSEQTLSGSSSALV